MYIIKIKNCVNFIIFINFKMDFLSEKVESYKNKIEDFNNDRTIKLYKDFTGEDFEPLQKKFDINSFLGKWEQVVTSRSTGVLGTGISLTNVSAIYGLTEEGNVSVFNSAYDQELKFRSIFGESRARSENIPCCRTVAFDRIPVNEGNYWITYINDDFSVIVVTAPVILLGVNIVSNFGFYALTKDRDSFWSNKEEVNKLYSYLEKKGFTTYINEPIVSGTSFI